MKSEKTAVNFQFDPDGCCSYAYICPKTGEGECLVHGGFDVCCDHPNCPGNAEFRNDHRPHLPVECWCGKSWDQTHA